MKAPARLRLRLRDGAATAAFAAMAISGQLPAWAMGLFALSLALSFLGRRIFARRAKLTAAALLAVAGALYLSVATGQLDLVVAACSLAGLTCAQRLLSTPDAATDNQVHLLGVLMLCGGAALSGEMTFALCLFAFTLLAGLSVGLAVIETAVGPDEEVPVRAALRPLSVGIGFAIFGALAFFVLFPRLHWNLAARGTSPGLGPARTGFSDRVRLGSGTGTLKSSPRVVLRATLTPDPGSTRLERYWLGRTFDTFDGQEWTSTGEPQPAQGRVVLHEPVPGALQQRIELTPAYGADTAISLEQPLSFRQAAMQGPSGLSRTGFVEVRHSEVRFTTHGMGYRYEATSAAPADGAWLDEETPPSTEALLGLPQTLDPRIPALAKAILGGERDALRAARKAERYLQREYAYTTELEGHQEDPLAHFLFERRAGHCEHFATALAVLLRAAGIPSRVATGFFGGERVGGLYVVRAGDAHAWAQVYVPGKGFATLDATPASFRAGQPVAVLQYLLGIYEALEEKWRAAVVDYSFRDQVDLVRDLSPAKAARKGGGERHAPPPLKAWMGGALAAALTYGAWMLLVRRRRGPPRHGATKLLEAAERALESGAIPREPSESLEHLARRLRDQGHPLAGAVNQLSDRYLAARFGTRPLAAGEAQALLRALRRDLRAYRLAS